MPLNKWCFFVFIICKLTVYSQADNEQILQQRIEFLAEKEGAESIDLTSLLDNWNYFLEHPINLNNTNEEELSLLSLLNDFQIRSLLVHINTNGKLISIYELQSIEYWDVSTISLIHPFITISERIDQPHFNLYQLKTGLNSELLLRTQRTIEEKKGFSESSQIDSSGYLGSEWGNYLRYRLKYRTNFSFGFTLANDAGEKNTKQQLVDFSSIHVYFKGGKIIESFAIGDYMIQIGQGLNCWNGYSFGKSSDLLQLKRNSQSISPYVSADETRFLRGGALNLKWKNWNLVNFYSNKKIDGTIDSLNGEQYIKSLTQTGLHRTSSEMSRRHSVQEIMYGSDLSFHYSSFKVGASLVNQSYQYPYLKDTMLYNQFDFRGKQLTNLSLHYNWQLKKGILFGEYAQTMSKNSYAFITGGIFALSQKIMLSLLYRNYNRSFYSFYNNALSEGTKVQNEKGILFGIQYAINKSLNINGYFDYFIFPWLKYQVDAPSNGYDGLVQLNYQISKKANCYFRFQRQIKYENSTINQDVSSVFGVLKDEFRFQIQFHVSESFYLRNRFDLVQTKNEFTNGVGYLFYQDVIFKSKDNPFSFTFRVSIFNTDSYDQRVYAYENNVVGIYSVPAYYGKGTKVFGIFKYKLFNKGDLNFRIGRTTYFDRTEIGTGLEQIDGNHKTELVLQFRLLF